MDKHTTGPSSSPPFHPYGAHSILAGVVLIVVLGVLAALNVMLDVMNSLFAVIGTVAVSLVDVAVSFLRVLCMRSSRGRYRHVLRVNRSGGAPIPIRILIMSLMMVESGRMQKRLTNAPIRARENSISIQIISVGICCHILRDV